MTRKIRITWLALACLLILAPLLTAGLFPGGSIPTHDHSSASQGGSLGSGVIASSMLGLGIVSSAQLASGAVGTAQLANGAVTQAKLAGPITGTLTAGTTLTKNPVAFSSTTTQAHGLSAQPTFFTVRLTNLTAECNWSIGDVVMLSYGSGHGNGEGIDIQVDATNIYLHITTLINISNKTTFLNCGITAANWRIDVISYVAN